MTTAAAPIAFADYGAVHSPQGLDVSNYQGRFDWPAAKTQNPQLAFGIYKLTEGLGYTDPQASANHDGIKAAGLIHGSYHFMHATESGTAQAEFFLAEHEKIGLDEADMLWLDHEDTTPGVSAALAAQRAADFMTTIVRHRRHNPHGVYTFIDYARTGHCTGLGRYALWLAYPSATAPTEPPPWFGPRFKFWQWGTRNGVDADAFMGSAAELHAWLASFARHPGPYRHITPGGQSAAQLAGRRHTTVEHLAEVSAAAYTSADLATAAGLPLPAGLPFYTSMP